MGVALLHRVVSQEATILRNKTGINNIDLRFLNAPAELHYSPIAAALPHGFRTDLRSTLIRTVRKLIEPGLRPACPLHPRRDRLQRLPALGPKLRELGLERAGRALGLRPLDPLPIELLSGLRQGVAGRLAFGLDPRQLRFEPSDLLGHLRPELLLLGPFPLELLTLWLVDGVGRFPGFGPQVLNEVKDPLGDGRHRRQDCPGLFLSPLIEHGPDGRIAAAPEPLADRGD